MVLAGYAVEIVFGVLGLVPDQRSARVMEASVRLNYTSVLNVVLLLLAATLVVRALRTGVIPMLRMMDEPIGEETDHRHGEEITMQTEPGETTYTCPMHAEVVSSEPGRCPKCGMNLEPQQAAERE